MRGTWKRWRTSEEEDDVRTVVAHLSPRGERWRRWQWRGARWIGHSLDTPARGTRGVAEPQRYSTSQSRHETHGCTIWLAELRDDHAIFYAKVVGRMDTLRLALTLMKEDIVANSAAHGVIVDTEQRACR